MKNKILTYIQLLIICFVLLPGNAVLGQVEGNSVPNTLQDQKTSFDQKYGLDPNLLNGIKYTYPYANIAGHPFLLNKGTKGNIQINGKSFPGEKIRFDILYNQVILDYLDQSNNQQSIVLRNEWVDQFSLSGMHFKKVLFEENKERFVQVIYDGDISCYFDWTKEQKLASGSGSHYYYFTDAMKTGILFINGEEKHFRMKRSFLKHFQKEEKQKIKRYLKSEKIRFNKANYKEMEVLMNYCNQY